MSKYIFEQIVLRLIGAAGVTSSASIVAVAYLPSSCSVLSDERHAGREWSLNTRFNKHA